MLMPTLWQTANSTLRACAVTAVSTTNPNAEAIATAASAPIKTPFHEATISGSAANPSRACSSVRMCSTGSD